MIAIKSYKIKRELIYLLKGFCGAIILHTFLFAGIAILNFTHPNYNLIMPTEKENERIEKIMKENRIRHGTAVYKIDSDKPYIYRAGQKVFLKVGDENDN